MKSGMSLAGVATLILGIIHLSGCLDTNTSGPSKPASTFATVSGTILEPDQGGVGDVPVTIVQAGQQCHDIGDPNIVSETNPSDGQGLFVVSVEDRNGFRGAGCARLHLELPEGIAVLDPDNLTVSVTFFTTTPLDTAQITIEVARSGGS